MSESKIAVTFIDEQYATKAAILAEKLKLPCLEHPSKDIEFLLIYENDCLTLDYNSEKLGKPIYANFLSGKEGYRLKHLQHELILKAVGCKQSFRPSVIDATAGLANDSFILASNGCEVFMLEKSPIIAALVEDGLERFFANSQEVKLKISLRCMDSKVYLQQQTEKLFDVIYLDPMFPSRKKSALVKKEMRVLQKLLTHDDDINELFYLALKTAKKRVVVKRPLSADLLTPHKPDIQYKGKSVRFDVYLVK
jgi:16S rRNA (guanine1516-N2)-methyltransferase